MTESHTQSRGQSRGHSRDQVPGLLRVLAMALLVALPHWTSAGEWRWTGVERIVAISDVHGAYHAMVRTLQNAGVLDAGARWQGGSAHLVITGDILDRGAESRRVMDLLMRLEAEAHEAGGRVHLLLGNHEVMNLVGDLRYVSAAEYAAFADDEHEADRERAFRLFQAARSTTDEEALRRQFSDRAPPGYFGHRQAFSPDGAYGRWLLQKPLVVVINDTAFVHGGLSPLVAQLGLDGVNRELLAQVASYAAHLDLLTGENLLDATENFYRHPELVDALLAEGQVPADLQRAMEGISALNGASVHASDSPLWYRGNVGCGILIESDRLDAALESIGAARVVIGHTPTPGRQVLHRLDGRVIEIDTGMLTASYGGSGHALVIEGDRLSVVSETGEPAPAPAAHPRHADAQAAGLDVPALEKALASGRATARASDTLDRRLVELEVGERRLTAQFLRNPRGRNVSPELAAYRLDRMLQLDMVPVTAAREISGEQGVLQLLPAAAQNESTRVETGEGASAWCPLPEQWNAMYLFDALAYNTGRKPESMLYAPGNWHLTLVSHGDAFFARNGRPPWLRNAEMTLGNAWIEALTSLNDELLNEELSDVLDNRRLRALSKRRDGLLKQAL